MKDDSDEADSDEEAEEEDSDNSNTWMVRSIDCFEMKLTDS